jgi:hypothetical protein
VDFHTIVVGVMMRNLGILGTNCPSGRQSNRKNGSQASMGIEIHENRQAGGRRKFGQGIWFRLDHDFKPSAWPSGVYIPSAILCGVAWWGIFT